MGSIPSVGRAGGSRSRSSVIADASASLPLPPSCAADGKPWCLHRTGMGHGEGAVSSPRWRRRTLAAKSPAADLRPACQPRSRARPGSVPTSACATAAGASAGATMPARHRGREVCRVPPVLRGLDARDPDHLFVAVLRGRSPASSRRLLQAPFRQEVNVGSSGAAGAAVLTARSS